MIRTAIKFGLFVLLCLSFTVYLAFTIGNISLSDPFAQNYYTLSATFDDVTGLLPDDNVKIAGVVVGKVDSISVTDGRARVRFTVANDVSLPTDTTAAVRWRNLIGQRYLYLYPGSSTVTKLKNGDEIKDTTSVVDLGELFNRLGPIVAAIDPKQVNDFLDTVSQALDGNGDKLSKAIDDLATLAKGLSSRDQTIGRLVENLNTVTGAITDRDQQIRVMLDNLVLISQTFSANTQTLDTALQEFSRFSTNLNSVIGGDRAEIDRIIDNLDLIVHDVVDPRIGTLEHALEGLDNTAKAVFNSSRLGEWLNQSILCAATGPPGSGVAACDTRVTSGGVGTASAPGPSTASSTAPGSSSAGPSPASAALGPVSSAPTSADIGSRASSPEAGMTVLQQLLLGPNRGQP